MERREKEPIANDLKVSDSSGSDRNPLRLPSERLLRRIETSGDLFAAAPEAFGLSEVVLGAHVALAQKLRRADASQLKIASKVVGSFVPRCGSRRRDGRRLLRADWIEAEPGPEGVGLRRGFAKGVEARLLQNRWVAPVVDDVPGFQ